MRLPIGTPALNVTGLAFHFGLSYAMTHPHASGLTIYRAALAYGLPAGDDMHRELTRGIDTACGMLDRMGVEQTQH